MHFIQNLLQTMFMDNSLLQWISAALVIALVLLAQRLLQQVVVQRVRRLTERTRTQVDDLIADMLDDTRTSLVFLVALYIGTLPLTLPLDAAVALRTVAFVAVLVQIALWGNKVINFALEHFVKERAGDEASGQTAFVAMTFLSRLVLWSVVVLLVLDNIPGVHVTSLITGLGITGVAVALAVQNILSDLFASLSIVLDKPFIIGDFIIIDDYMGTVEFIGLKTTRVRSLSGEELVFSNSDMLNSRIRNYKKMFERRVLFSFGIAYETPYELVEQVPHIVREKIEAQDKTRFDRAHFASYGDSALMFEAVYYVQDADYNLYMDIQQAINLGLLKTFAEMHIEFAYPTQTVYMKQIKG